MMPQLGNHLYLAIDAGPIHDDDGNLIAVVETLRDMTEQKRAEMALKTLAAKDGLTGLANRRSFDQAMEMEWSRAQRSGKPLALLFADVDHFKLFNDHHGHQSGDECLRAVAAVIGRSAIRPTDLAARYGGEEFAIIMPDTDMAARVQGRRAAAPSRDGAAHRAWRARRGPLGHAQHRVATYVPGQEVSARTGCSARPTRRSMPPSISAATAWSATDTMLLELAKARIHAAQCRQGARPKRRRRSKMPARNQAFSFALRPCTPYRAAKPRLYSRVACTQIEAGPAMQPVSILLNILWILSAAPGWRSAGWSPP